MYLCQSIIPLILLCSALHTVKAQSSECYSKKTCDECISDKNRCAWCEDETYEVNTRQYYQRCDSLAVHKSQGCKKIANPPSSSKIDKEKPLDGDTRVSPQEITVKLRPGVPTTMTVKVKTPNNFPIDLYYLMDLSLSMYNDLQNLKKLSKLLANEMSSVSEKFRIGFGGFVDKPMRPYANANPSEVAKAVKQGNEFTYAFRNYLPLNEGRDEFSKILNNLNVSYNQDTPEGSLEALLQVIVCQNEIGWSSKKQARRIVIITTDANFHVAGDGLMGGYVIPTDGACYLSKDGNYTGWNKFDYPSLSYIKSMIIESEIAPIFATTGYDDQYKRVAQFLGEGSGAVQSRLAEDSSNIVPLIKDAYEKIAKVVSIRSNAPDGVNIKYKSNCKDGATDYCDNVGIGDEVVFEVTISIDDCKKVKDKTSFDILTTFDDIKVNLELVCSCECSKENFHVDNATTCNSNGTLVCGQCDCNEGRAGRFCQCNPSQAEDPELCRIPGTTGDVCSGLGKCECGDCICKLPELNEFDEMERIYGFNCNCSNATCATSNGGQICGGFERGECKCGTCECNEDWTGPGCGQQCLKTEAGCFRDGMKCGGKGECICGRCKCKDGYIGDQCQECVNNCPDPCVDYRECVKCDVFETTEKTRQECDVECAKWNITKTDVINKVDENARCIARDEDGCSIVFTYEKSNKTKEVKLIVQRERICPAEPDILAIILGVIAGIVGIGLALLLIWKLLATIQDRREFARFENETKFAKWDTAENPIFKQATSTFQNPTYGGSG